MFVIIIISMLLIFLLHMPYLTYYPAGPTDAKTLDPDLIIPVCDKLCCCLPESFRRKFRLDNTETIIPREADVCLDVPVLNFRRKF